MSERVLFAKMTQVRRHLTRVRDRLPSDEMAFLSDQDLQDVVVHNLWLALQGCIDIAAHVVSDEGLGQPSGLGEVFDILGEHADLCHRRAGYRVLRKRPLEKRK